MKRFGLPVFLSLIIQLSLGLSVQAQVLNVPEIIQEQTNWCWAASSKCVLDYFGFVHPQCEIAEYTRTVATWHDFGNVNCCIDPNQGCNYWNYNWYYAGSIEDILLHFGNIHTINLESSITIPEIQTEVNAARPFIFRWGWYTGGGHFLVGYGIIDTDMYFMNPLPGYGYEIAAYSWVIDDGDHTWTHTQTLCLPSIPGSISGNTNVCESSSQTYSISPVSGATSYTWTLPPGWTGSSNSNSITTTAGDSSGTIYVTASNSCGTSIPQTLSVSVAPFLSQPGSISGNNDVCQGSLQTYSISPVSGATSYTWTLPPGWTGSSNTTLITSTSGNNGGLVSVTANNFCSTSPASSLPVTVTIVDTSVTTSGNTLISNAAPAAYQWVSCPEMIIIPGETGKSFTPVQNGSYGVIVNQGNCDDTSKCHVVIVTDINSLEDESCFAIYPNPAKGQITIETCRGYEKLTVFNILGEPVKEIILTMNKSVIDLSGLSKGLYLIKLSNATKAVFRHLVLN